MSVASLHIDVHPRLPGVMAEHPRSQKQELQPLRAQQQRSLHSLWINPRSSLKKKVLSKVIGLVLVEPRVSKLASWAQILGDDRG